MTANTITGLRVNQWGVEAVKATSTLTLGVQPTAGKTIIVGGVTYTFRAAVDTDASGEISIGNDLAAAKLNLRAAINGDSLNDPNPRVTMAAFAGDDAVVSARHPGPTGNNLVFTGTWTDDVGNSATTFANGAFARGTAVAATSKIAVERLEWADDDENLYRPNIANGLLIRNSGRATPVQHGTRFTLGDQPVVWEQLPHWLSMAVKGDVIPTIEAGPVFEWAFVRDPSTDPQAMSWTLQRRFNNGAGATIDQRAAYAMLSSLTFRYAQNEHLRMSAAGFARRFETSAITSALTLPDPHLGVSALSSVFVNDSWAAIGNTQLTEQVIGWELAIGTGLFPQPTADGRPDLDFTKHLINSEEVTLGLRMTVLLDPTTYAAEAAAAEAGNLRAVRIRVVGGAGRQVDFDVLVQHSKPSLFRIGEQDGQDIVEIEYEEATDNTNFLAVTLTHPNVGDLT